VIILVKVTFKPMEEVIIHDSVHYQLEDLIKLITINVNLGARAAPLTWTKGVVFTYILLLPDTSEAVAEDLLEGKTHWFNVQCDIDVAIPKRN
jgi:hypothetical protein